MSQRTSPIRFTQYLKGKSYQAVAEPGNSTRYWVVVGTDADGNGFVALPDFGVAATMAWEWHVVPSYVREKLGRKLTDADCEMVAEILNTWVSMGVDV